VAFAALAAIVALALPRTAAHPERLAAAAPAADGE
jgi:hypothetical protein